MSAQPPGPFPVMHLVAVAVGEGLVATPAVLRMVLSPASVDLGKPAHLVWLVACFVMAGLAPASFVVRSAALTRRERAGESVADERKQVLVMSLALLLPAAVVAFAGPALVEAVLK